MLNYIEQNCQLPPLERPLYDEDAGTWDLWMEEKGNQHFVLDDELICVPFETKEEAEETYEQAIKLHAEEVPQPVKS